MANTRGQGAPGLSGFAILVVEDDSDSRELLRVALQSHGADVLEAEEVLTAQQWVRTRKLDLVIADLALPGRDGAALLKWLRQQPKDRGGALPAIAVTAYEARYPPMEVSGWAAYLRKPVDPDDVVRLIAAILKPPSAATDRT